MLYLVGAGPLALKTFTWARELDLKIAATDVNPRAAGRDLADEFRCIDAEAHPTEHLDFVRELSEQYDICSVYCGNEIGTENVARIQEALQLPALQQSVITCIKNKLKMKSAFLKKGIRSPKYWSLKNVSELESLLETRQQTLVLKPSLGSGSRGVKILFCSDQADAKSLWQECTAEVDKDDTLIAEEFIEGRSIDVNGIVTPDKFLRAGVLEKYITSPPYCLPLGGHAPTNIGPDIENEIFSMLQNGSKAVGLDTGPVKADFIICNKTKRPYLLELAARFHGDITTCNTLPFSQQINPLKAYFSYCKNLKPDQELAKKSKGYATWRVLCLPPGNNYSELFQNQDGEHEGISVVWFNHRHNETTLNYNNTRHIPGYICAYGKDEHEATENIERFFEKIRPTIALTQKGAWYASLATSIKQLGLSTASFCYLENEHS